MNIVIKGRQATRKEAPILVCAPHSTFLDGGIVYVTGFPSIIVRRESGMNPYIGSTYYKLFRLYHVLLMDISLIVFTYTMGPLYKKAFKQTTVKYTNNQVLEEINYAIISDYKEVKIGLLASSIIL